jgi:hypothetical protein
MGSLERFLLNAPMSPPEREEGEAHNSKKDGEEQKAEEDRESLNLRGVRARGVPHRLTH